MTAPVLVLACGNPSRGDDGLAPALAEALEREYAAAIASGELEVLTELQLNVEHALELRGRRRVYLVDAAASGPEVSLEAVAACRDDSFTTHRISPSALLEVYRQIERSPLPDCRLLAVRGERFELGEPFSPRARASFDEALRLLRAELGGGSRPLRGG
ncbi:MAG: hydrogenase maturation protease [Archangiaceae bacterium]|nr:hydrogenase maturation protease [Archangiaceae bacterium]